MKKIQLGVGFWIIVISFTLVGLILWGVLSSEKKNNDISLEKTSREVALTCTTDMATQFHIHSELKIFINGKEEIIPSNIGVTPECMNSIHTHDAIGTLHVEAPVKKDFALGDFFAVWKKEFNRNQILDSKVDSTSLIEVTVNGKEVDTYENTLLNDGDKIIINYLKK